MSYTFNPFTGNFDKVHDIVGTTNQVAVAKAGDLHTLSTPQDIHTGATPSFADVNIALPEYTNLLVGKASVDMMSTGLLSGGYLAVSSATQIDIDGGEAIFVDELATPKTYNKVTFTGQTVTITGIAGTDFTYLLLLPNGTIAQQATYPTASQRRDYVYLGRVNHSNRTSITAVKAVPDLAISTPANLNDLMESLGPFNIMGNEISANGANLSFNKSSGRVFQKSFGYDISVPTANIITTGSSTPVSFRRATQLNPSVTTTTLIDPANYDVAGTITTIPGSNNNASVQRVYLLSSNNVIVQYAQSYHNSLGNAIAAIATEQFIANPQVSGGFGILIGYIAVVKNATDLSNPLQAVFIRAAKFDTGIGGASATSAESLQEAYENSTNPEITLDSTRGGVQIVDNATPLGTELFSVADNTGTTKYLGVSATGLTTTNFTGTGTTGAITLHNLTTSQRNALTEVAGMIVHDTDLDLPMWYNGAEWEPLRGTLVPTTITLTEAQAVPLLDMRDQLVRIAGPSGLGGTGGIPITTYAKDGDKVTIMGMSDTATVTFSPSTFFLINGPITLGVYDTLTLMYLNATWVEIGRSN